MSAKEISSRPLPSRASQQCGFADPQPSAIGPVQVVEAAETFSGVNSDEDEFGGLKVKQETSSGISSDEDVRGNLQIGRERGSHMARLLWLRREAIRRAHDGAAGEPLWTGASESGHAGGVSPFDPDSDNGKEPFDELLVLPSRAEGAEAVTVTKVRPALQIG